MDNDKQTLLVEVELPYDAVAYNAEGICNALNCHAKLLSLDGRFTVRDLTGKVLSMQRVAEVLDHCKDFRDFDYNKGWNAALEMVRDILLPAPPATPEPRP